MALFSTTEFKTHYGITVTTYDAFIATLATSITASVKRYLRRNLEGVSYQEITSGNGRKTLSVRHPPIRSAAPTVYISSDQTWDATTKLAAADFRFDSDAGIFIRIDATLDGLLQSDDPIWPEGNMNIRIDYDGGFSAVPDDVKMGAMIWAGMLFNRRKASGISSRSVGGYSESFTAQIIPREARALLDPYRGVQRTRFYG